MEPETNSKQPIVNCHTHIFTKDHVPPFLAKQFLPWPFYYFLYTPCILQLIIYYKKVEQAILYDKHTLVYKINIFFHKVTLIRKRNQLAYVIYFLLSVYVILNITFYISEFIVDANKTYTSYFNKVLQWYVKKFQHFPYRLVIENFYLKAALVFFSMLLLKSVRSFFVFLGKLLKLIPGKKTTALIGRYLEIAEYAKYKKQAGIFNVSLNKQYPSDTKFIVLPMDMEFMGAGKLKKEHSITAQMAELKDIKINNPHTFLPFVFADPRRMKDKSYFDYEVQNGKVILKEGCLMQEYFEVHKFSGIKLYPALGYYPFDEMLLPLYKYAADHDIPIMTHCIKGTIFYRGRKKKEWNYHPVFKENEQDKVFLKESKNVNFCNNFTHPLNYLCLLDEDLLYQVIQNVTDVKLKNDLKELFPFHDTLKTIKKGKGLSNLKLCLAHFGGEDQWKQFMEKDRFWASNRLITAPEKGISFFNDKEEHAKSVGVLWNRQIDWYTIICSMLLQYENTYADISYIVHDILTFPLLKFTVNHGKLGDKVLFGTDFYVVRNHNSDKEILIDLQAGLTTKEFDKIARINPEKYINNKLQKEIAN